MNTNATTTMPQQVRRSLRAKLVFAILLVAGLSGFATLATVAYASIQSSAAHLRTIQDQIAHAMDTEGRLLVENHSAVLKGLLSDNAYIEVQGLVRRGVVDNSDVAYGILVEPGGKTIAYEGRGALGADDKQQPLANEPWKKAGLDPVALGKAVDGSYKWNMQGLEILEMVRTVKLDGEVAAVLHYGISTQRMRNELDSARLRSKQELLRLLGTLLGVVAASAVLGLLLARREASRVVDPVLQLTGAAKKFAGGDRSIEVKLTSGDEVEILAGAFNTMVRELGEYQRDLEHKVEERTAALASRNRDMRLVLDNVDVGFVTLSREGAMATEHSAVMDRWFGPYEGNPAFSDYLARASSKVGMQFRLGWDMLMEGFMPVELCLDQLPKRIKSSAQTWELRYVVIGTHEALDGVLVVMTDITDRLAREREEAEQRELLSALRHLVRDRSGLLLFVRETARMVTDICNGSMNDDLAAFKRTLHTIKGNAALFGMQVVAQIAHELEDRMAEGGSLTAEEMRGLLERWEKVSQNISMLAGERPARGVEIDDADYQALLTLLSQAAPLAEIRKLVESWTLEPVERPLKRLGEKATALAHRLGKTDVEVEIFAERLRLDPEALTSFWSEMGHVVRNAVDHGLPDASSAPGMKSRIWLSARRFGEMLEVEIADFGRGIDWELVSKCAQKRGMPHSTREELVAALCTDGFTTREHVSDVSGRGVGMAAVRRAVEAVRGKLEVSSELGSGTRWRFIIPLPQQPTPSVRIDSTIPRAVSLRPSIAPGPA